jgi:hypothetical protein
MLLGLWWLRDHFRAQSDPASVRRGVRVLVAVLFLALAYTVMGTWLLSSQLAPAVELRGTLDNLADAFLQNQSVYRALSARGPWFLGSLPWVAYTLVPLKRIREVGPVSQKPLASAVQEQIRAGMGGPLLSSADCGCSVRRAGGPFPGAPPRAVAAVAATGRSSARGVRGRPTSRAEKWMMTPW